MPFLLAAAAIAAGCAPSNETSVAIEEGLADRAGHEAVRLQAGTKLITYGVTDDDYVVYQDGPSLYATRLAPGAPRRLIADVGDQQPLVMVRGRVAFVWTQQFYFGAGGTSPLIVWTAAAGPKLAADSSIGSFISTRAVTLSPDGRQIIFIANVDSTGTIGDLVVASPDLSVRQTLVAGVNVDFNGTCPPLAGFDRRFAYGRANPVAAYCPAGATTATLSRWVSGVRTDLSTHLATAPRWSSDEGGHQFVSLAADTRAPIAISASGVTTVLEDTPALQAFIERDGTIVATSKTPNGNEIHRFTGQPPHQDVVAGIGSGVLFTGHFDEGFRQYSDTSASPDGKLLMYSTGSDPNTGLGDMNVVDLSTTPPRTRQLQPIGGSGVAFEIFTADSSHVLYYQIDPTTGGATLFAGAANGENRQISDGTPTEFVHFGVGGTHVVYSDHMNGTGSGLYDLHDMVAADVGAPTIQHVVLASQIYNLFWVNHDRRWAVYTSDSDPKGTGLFAVRTH